MGGTAVVLACVVTLVTDGDSLHAACGDRTAQIVRLAEIDAPEVPHCKQWRQFANPPHCIESTPAQPWGHEAKQALVALCQDKPAEIQPITTDRYGRMVAKVRCAGVDAAAEMVRSGNAWAFMPLPGSVTPRLERQARAQRLGLWSLPDRQVRPADWRHGGGKSWEWERVR